MGSPGVVLCSSKTITMDTQLIDLRNKQNEMIIKIIEEVHGRPVAFEFLREGKKQYGFVVRVYSDESLQVRFGPRDYMFFDTWVDLRDVLVSII
jgi:hypothetical protein